MYTKEMHEKLLYNAIKIDYDSNEICIKIPIDLLIFAQENNPNNPCKIKDREQMVKHFQEYFLSFGEDEGKGAEFETLLDKFFEDATEYGQLWIDSVEFEEE